MSLLQRRCPGRCGAVGDPGVAALAAGNPGLEVLRVDHCGKVSDVAMLAVAESCRRLRVPRPRPHPACT